MPHGLGHQTRHAQFLDLHIAFRGFLPPITALDEMQKSYGDTKRRPSSQHSRQTLGLCVSPVRAPLRFGKRPRIQDSKIPLELG
jgi:hypothetical protein